MLRTSKKEANYQQYRYELEKDALDLLFAVGEAEKNILVILCSGHLYGHTNIDCPFRTYINQLCDEMAIYLKT